MVTARDIMTTEIASVGPAAPTRQIARLMLDKGISAVPVVDERGSLVGMVSEGDLIERSAADREARRDWWLALLAEGETLHPDFLATLRKNALTARDVMAAPVVSVGETTEAAEIAALLRQYRIKRVPVVRDGRVVGIVSRADLLRALSAEHENPQGPGHASREPGPIGEIIASIDARFRRRDATTSTSAQPAASTAAETGLTAGAFRALEADFHRHNDEQLEHAQRLAAEQRRQRVKELIEHHIADETWRSILHRAREAAMRGEKELMLLRFPADVCTDRGRAINAPSPDWPRTLRGEAAELYLRWERDLKPSGFRASARVLDFPDGFPGDIGFFLMWD